MNGLTCESDTEREKKTVWGALDIERTLKIQQKQAIIRIRIFRTSLVETLFIVIVILPLNLHGMGL